MRAQARRTQREPSTQKNKDGPSNRIHRPSPTLRRSEVSLSAARRVFQAQVDVEDVGDAAGKKRTRQILKLL
jgi:hypothetical protein